MSHESFGLNRRETRSADNSNQQSFIDCMRRLLFASQETRHSFSNDWLGGEHVRQCMCGGSSHFLSPSALASARVQHVNEGLRCLLSRCSLVCVLSTTDYSVRTGLPLRLVLSVTVLVACFETQAAACDSIYGI